MLIDSHCHLEYDYSPKTTSDLVQEAYDEGIHYLVTIGTEIQTLDTIQSISESYSNVHHTVGVHPHEVDTLKKEDMDTLRAYAKHPKCVAIGETGMDLYYEHSQKESQIKWLNEQLQISLEQTLPVVIHARDAEPELKEHLEPFAKKWSASGPPGVIHCFTGSSEFGKFCLDLGFMISFSGILTFKNAQNLRDFAKEVPLDALLVETDSPYLAPVPMRGKPCEPRFMKYTAEKLAELKHLSLEELANHTTSNTKKLFSQLDT